MTVSSLSGNRPIALPVMDRSESGDGVFFSRAAWCFGVVKEVRCRSNLIFGAPLHGVFEPILAPHVLLLIVFSDETGNQRVQSAVAESLVMDTSPERSFLLRIVSFPTYLATPLLWYRSLAAAVSFRVVDAVECCTVDPSRLHRCNRVQTV